MRIPSNEFVTSWSCVAMLLATTSFQIHLTPKPKSNSTTISVCFGSSASQFAV